MKRNNSPLIFEQGAEGRRGVDIPDPGKKEQEFELPEELLRGKLPFPEVSEPEAIRHYTRLSQKDYGVDSEMYPLGSCTMKYNPRVNEIFARLPGFAAVHPETPARLVQGALHIMYDTERMLSEICGMAAFTLAPCAGAHGELTGMKIIRAALRARGETRTKVLLPVTAHGTNPASAVLSGFKTIVPIPLGQNGILLPEDVAKAADKDTAALMLTNPNTLGLFESNIAEIAKILHDAGAYLYCDGANMNALTGIARPGDMGADVIQLNLHKTFSTPHGGGGPGSGPVGVSKDLVPFLPSPRVVDIAGMGIHQFEFAYPKESIGRVSSFFGNFLVVVRAYAYIMSMGAEGMKVIAENAVLNANYLRVKLAGKYHVPYDAMCMHEFVANDKTLEASGATTMDVAKRLLEKGFHPMTVYFPLCVHAAMLIEPTETESREELDKFVEAMMVIEAGTRLFPETHKEAPVFLPIRRVDETGANKTLDLRWKPKSQ